MSPKLGEGYDKADYTGVITRVYVQDLHGYLSEKHGDKADEIIDKFQNVTRDNIIVVAHVAEINEDIEGFYTIPKASGWNQSNIKAFMALNGLASVDPEDQADLDTWLGREVKVVWESTSKGKFLRLDK